MQVHLERFVSKMVDSRTTATGADNLLDNPMDMEDLPRPAKRARSAEEADDASAWSPQRVIRERGDRLRGGRPTGYRTTPLCI